LPPALLPILQFDPPAVVLSALPAQRSADPGFDESLFDRRRFADVGRGLPVDAPTSRSNNPLDASTVDTPVAAKGNNPVPHYPSLLASAGVEGSVVMNFVVDTLGVVEKRSIVALHSSHALFEQAVRDALVRMRFTPAQVHGRNVRQLVEQTFVFSLNRDSPD
jgi:TonB family protein